MIPRMGRIGEPKMELQLLELPNISGMRNGGGRKQEGGGCREKENENVRKDENTLISGFAFRHVRSSNKKGKDKPHV